MKGCLEAENALSASCVLLPELDGVTVQTFSCSVSKLEHHVPDFFPTMDTDGPDAEGLQAITGIPESTRPKLVLLFATESSISDADLPTALVLHFRNVAVVGGLVDNLLVHGSHALDDAADE